MTLYCAIDLHSTNNVPVVIDENDKILFQKRLPNDLTVVHSALAPYQFRINQSITNASENSDTPGVDDAETDVTGFGGFVAMPPGIFASSPTTF